MGTKSNCGAKIPPGYFDYLWVMLLPSTVICFSYIVLCCMKWEVRIETKLNQESRTCKSNGNVRVSLLGTTMSLLLSYCAFVFINNWTNAKNIHPVYCSCKKQQLTWNWHETWGFGPMLVQFCIIGRYQSKREDVFMDTDCCWHTTSRTSSLLLEDGSEEDVRLTTSIQRSRSQPFCNILYIWSIFIQS